MLTGKKVLIFDDTPLIAVDIEQIVTDLGAESIVVLEPSDGEARKTMDSQIFDLAIVDHTSMQVLSLDLMAELSKQNASVILLTTDPDAPDAPGSAEMRSAPPVQASARTA